MAGLAFGVVLVASTVQNATADVAATGSVLVGETPRSDTPIVLDGRVNANVQFGDLIVVGGSFASVQTAGGTMVMRSNLMAYDINSGDLVESFDPVIDGEIFALEVANDGSGLFVGGTFNTVDGVERRKLVKLTANGDVDHSFVVDVNARVQAIDDDGKRVYFGGSFSTVNGEDRLQLAAVDVGTGALSTLRADVTESLGLDGGGSVRAVDVHPSGRYLLVAHASARVAGQPRAGVAQIDLTTDQLSDWRTDWYANAHARCADGGALTIRDAEYSPDGDAFYVVEKGHYECDKVIKFPAANGPGLEQNIWVTQMYDSSLSVGATRDAVYVGGHFCFVNPLGPIHSDDAATYAYVDKPAGCEPGGNETTNGIEARYQIAALHPTSGAPLPWDPRSNTFEGILDIEVIDRGLLFGHDLDQLGGLTTGRHAFIEGDSAASGYILLSADGKVFTFGDVPDHGDVVVEPGTTAVALAASPTGKGYLVVTSDWRVISFGDAPKIGPDLANLGPGDTPVDIQIDRLGRGYWLFSANGAVVPVGTVPWFGDAGKLNLASTIVAASVDDLGNGYRLLGGDGGVFSYGAARFLGSIPQVLPGQALQCPIVGLVDSGADGYWLVGCDGGVFAFGNAPFVGSLPGLRVTPREPVNGMVPYGAGYLLIAEDGGVFAFGGPFLGSLGDIALDAPIVSIAAV